MQVCSLAGAFTKPLPVPGTRTTLPKEQSSTCIVGHGGSYWREELVKRILVTGGGGFIGRHLADELIHRDYEVRILDALVEQVHGSATIEVPTGVELVKGDVRDAAKVAECLQG